MKEKINRLINYCQGIYKGEEGSKLYQKYLEDIKSITPEEVIQIEHAQLELGLSAEDMLGFVDKLMNVFHASLSNQALGQAYPKFIQNLKEENHQMEKLLNDFKDKLQHLEQVTKEELLSLVEALQLYQPHMEKIENILFSALEKEADHFKGLQIMWALHDKIRQALKTLHKSAQNQAPIDLVVEIGSLYFLMLGAVQKQNLVLFPVAVKRLKLEQFDRMYKDSFEYGFSYIEAPEQASSTQGASFDVLSSIIDTGTGELPLKLLVGILNVLPVDFTMIDENDEVLFFNDTTERIFPRSKSIIGRNVRNCHPPASVHVVEEIIKSFRDKSKDKAEFWIQMKGMMIYIYYLPIFIDDVYKGTLEISQEISKLRKLEGQKRLLDWA